ncbi:ABC transporter substrate-binding protein [Xiamenia xianingshaonis]|uniref:ABC transporter substrate-binding protein n=1 Tax=Xiamenia xianingshaonis TaxID=2682776 RepID=UPI0013EA760C|nr:ABC transporter substrate-binding protein [Xiamenia xianingshaonis]
MAEFTRRQFLGMAGALGLGAASLGFFGCGSNAASSSTTASSSSASEAAPSFDPSDWDSVLEAAKGTTVTYIGYGQTAAYNDYFNNVFAPTIKEKYDLDFEYVQVENTADIITLWLDEKQAGLGEGEGTTDTGWVSGPYYADSKDSGILWGDYLQYLPNMKYYKKDVAGVATSDGLPINGTMSLFASAFETFIYDSDKIDEADVPHNAQELLEYAKANPGRVTYPALPDYHGSYAARALIMDICGSDVFANMPEDITAEEMKEQLADGFEYLRELNPYLWNEGKTYPTTYSDWVTMFADGSTDFIYGDAWVQSIIEAGSVPATTESIAWEHTITTPHFLTIPWDCPNLAGALVMCNEFLDIQSMCDRGVTGYPPATECMDLSKLDDEQKKALEECEAEYGMNSPSLEELAEVAVADIPAWTKPIFEELWLTEVSGKTN